MKEPKRIPLTDNPRTKIVKKIPLESNNHYPTLEEILDWYNEDHRKNDSQGLQQLESDQIN